MKLLRLFLFTAILVLANSTLPTLAHIKKGTFEIEGDAEGEGNFEFDTDNNNEGTITIIGFPFDITNVEFDKEDKWKITKMEFTGIRDGVIDFTKDPPEGDIDGNMFTIKNDENGNSTLKVEKVKPKKKERDNAQPQQGNSDDSSSLNFSTPDSLSLAVAPIDLIFLDDKIPTLNDPLLGGQIEIDDISVLAPAEDNSGWFLDKTNYSISVGNTEVLSAELVNIFLFRDSGDPMFDSEIQGEFKNIAINNVINSPYLDLLIEDVENDQARHLSIFSNILSATNDLTVSSSSNAKLWDDGTKTPEPSSIVGILALGILGGGATLKRKLKSANSTEK